jgi:hypothetical protein
MRSAPEPIRHRTGWDYQPAFQCVKSTAVMPMGDGVPRLFNINRRCVLAPAAKI